VEALRREELEFRFKVLTRRVQVCEDAHLNPMVGRTRAQRCHALAAQPLTKR
jgi:hypothetical protein